MIINNMKKNIFLLIIILFGLLLSSCSNSYNFEENSMDLEIENSKETNFSLNEENKEKLIALKIEIGDLYGDYIYLNSNMNISSEIIINDSTCTEINNYSLIVGENKILLENCSFIKGITHKINIITEKGTFKKIEISKTDSSNLYFEEELILDENLFIGGKKSIEISVDNFPINPIRDQGLESFSFDVNIENIGEYDINNNEAYLFLSGFNSANFNLNNTLKKLNSIDKYLSITYNDLTYLFDIIAGTIPMEIFINIFYQYQTKNYALLCFDFDSRICNIEDEKDYISSGAPIKIENFKQFPYSENSIKIQFDIVHKDNSLNSRFFESETKDLFLDLSQNNIYNMAKTELIMKENKLYYEVISDIEGLNCENTNTNSNIILLNNNKYTVSCIQDLDSTNLYQKQIEINLEYDYYDKISKQIEIQHIPR